MPEAQENSLGIAAGRRWSLNNRDLAPQKRESIQYCSSSDFACGPGRVLSLLVALHDFQITRDQL